MSYDAVTIDTNVFHRGGLHLEEGLLAQFHQFKDGLTQLIISEIVIRELRKHLRQRHKETREKFLSSLKNSHKVQVIASKDLDAMTKAIESSPSSDEVAKKRILDFVHSCGAAVISADTASMKDLIRLYFHPLPPFEPSGGKKDEFPDAIALLSLEAWASKNEKRILAISDDKGWKDYAKTSERIDVQDDLATALEILQKHSEEAKAAVAGMIERIEAGKAASVSDSISEYMTDLVSIHDYYAEASSAFNWESDYIEVEFEGYEFITTSEGGGLKIVRMSRDAIVAQIDIRVEVRATGEFTFTTHDSIDGDDIPIGTCLKVVEADYLIAALIEFHGNLGEAPESVIVENVEFERKSITIDFGDIEPDYDSSDEFGDDFLDEPEEEEAAQD